MIVEIRGWLGICLERDLVRGLEKSVLGSRSSRVDVVRVERVCVENEELKEVSMVRVKSGSGREV